MHDPEVRKLMQSVMGTSVNKFINQTQSVSDPELTGDEMDQRKGTERWNDSILEVQTLAGAKVKFALRTSHGARTGGADGVVPIVNNVAKYKLPSGGSLTIKFKGSRATVAYSTKDGDSYGGVGVAPEGEYIKKTDKVPKFDTAF